MAVTNPSAFHFVLPLNRDCNEQRGKQHNPLLSLQNEVLKNQVPLGGQCSLDLLQGRHKAGWERLMSSGCVPGDSSLETSPQLSDDKMRFFTLNANGVLLQTGATEKVMKKTLHCL